MYYISWKYAHQLYATHFFIKVLKGKIKSASYKENATKIATLQQAEFLVSQLKKIHNFDYEIKIF